jgi:ribonuclease P protein component
MIRSRADFARLGAEGRTRADRLVVVHFARNDLGHDRFGISTGRRLGGAVVRNRVRRRVREVLRALPNSSGLGWDILVVARPASVGVPFDELRSALERLLASVRASMMASS